MQSRRILVVYGTTHGQTAKIARRMADLLTASGDSVTIANVDELPPGLTLRAFDGVILGGSINAGHHQRRVRRFARANRETLNGMPSAFFSVSGAAAGHTDQERARAQQYVDAFLREAGWHPGLHEPVAGAMAYTQYGLVLRWILKRMSRKAGGPTDTSRDYEFTDWAQVERFAKTFAALIPRPSPWPVPATV